jgi:hypothetical protein
MNADSLTHKDLADLLGVSETTIKSYRRKFPGCFPVASRGKPIRFKSGSKDIALRIRDAFSAGMSVEELGVKLELEFPWFSCANGNELKNSSASVNPEDLSKRFAAAMGSLAKSMLSMANKQEEILKILKRIEDRFFDSSGLPEELNIILKDDNGHKSKDVEISSPEGFADFSSGFFSLPLVTSDDVGSYTGVGSDTLEIISVNDLKKVLDDGCLPPEKFSLTLKKEEGGCLWVNLIRNSVTARDLRLSILVREGALSGGTDILEVRKFLYNGEERALAEFVLLCRRIMNNG